jgi:hypothetical protein
VQASITQSERLAEALRCQEKARITWEKTWSIVSWAIANIEDVADRDLWAYLHAERQTWAELERMREQSLEIAGVPQQ